MHPLREVWDRRRVPILLALLLGLQALISLPRLSEPFTEGRAHWYIDSAGFLLRAIHSQDRTLPSRLGLFGLKQYSYDEQGAVSGYQHYNHHPVLPSLLFNAYSRILGYSYWVPRSFALLIAMSTSLVLFWLLRQATQDAALAFLLSLLYVLLPLDYNYQDAWKHEGVVALLVCSCFLALFNSERPAGRRAFLPLFFLLFQSGWAAYPAGAGMLLYMLLKDEGRLRVWLKPALAIAAASIALNIFILHSLGATGSALQAQAVLRMQAGLQGVGARAWAARQWGFALFNFGGANIAVMLLLLAAACLPGAAPRHPLTLFGAMTWAGALAWICVFRNQSHIHHYVQWLLGTSYPLLCAGAYCTWRERLPARAGRLRQAALAAAAVLCALCLPGDKIVEDAIHENNFAAVEDVETIALQTRRVVVSLDGSSGPKDWWLGSVATLYSDPFYKAWRLGLPRSAIRGGLAYADHPLQLDPRTDVIVALDSAGAIRHLGAVLRKQSGLSCMRLQATTPAFAFFSPVLGGDCKGAGLRRL